jgi:hypothetical protein
MPSKGSYCIVVDKPLARSACPLKPGTCLWQHTETNGCRYRPDITTVEELAAAVGREVPPLSEVDAFKTALRAELAKP